MLTIRGKNNADGSFDWSDALIDAGIYAGSGFFNALLVAVADGNLLPFELIVAGITAGGLFFGFLGLKRKITKQPK